MRVTRAWLVSGVLGALLALGGCDVGSVGPMDDPPPEDPPPGDTNTLSGDITDSVSLSGQLTLEANATVKPGVVLVIEPGSELVAADGASLTVQGELRIEGNVDATVSINPEASATAWTGVIVEAGGSATIQYATGSNVALLLHCKSGAAGCVVEGIDFTDVGQVLIAEATAVLDRSRVVGMANGGVTVRGSGDLTVRDSYLLTSTHDLIVASGGSLTIEYSEIGGATPESYEHCDLHIGAASALSISYTNIISSEYGMMIGGVSNAVITNNNFEGNDPNQDIAPVGTVTNADLRNNYWDKGAPVGLGGEYDVSSPAAARIATAGPRI